MGMSQVLSAENGSTTAFGTGGFMAMHAMRAMSVSASLGVGYNPSMAGTLGFGPGVGAVNPRGPTFGFGGVPHYASISAPGFSQSVNDSRLRVAAQAVNFGGVLPASTLTGVNINSVMPFLSAIAHSTARSAQIEQEQLNNIRHMVPPGTVRAIAPAPMPAWLPPGTMQAPGAPPGIGIPPVPGGGGGGAGGLYT